MKPRLLFVAPLFLIVIASGGLGTPGASGLRAAVQPSADTTPTFNKDVAPIIFGRCVSCHRPNQVAPMSLMSFDEVRPFARAIKNKVIDKQMPPWFADERFGEFANDRRLTETEIKTIVDWADGGAPQGDTPLVAKLPAMSDGWSHPSGRPPDMVIEMEHPFDGPADGVIPNFNYYQELPAELKKEDHFLEAIQVLPEVVRAMHHASFGVSSLPPGGRIGSGPAWPGGPVIANALLRGVAPDRTDAAGTAPRRQTGDAGGSNFCCYVPGGGFMRFPPGAGKRIPKDGSIVWGLHYTTFGKPFADRTRVGLWFQSNLTREVVDKGASLTSTNDRNNIVLGTEIIQDQSHPVSGGGTAGPALPLIPPYAKNWAITAIIALSNDTTLYTVWPHMHLRGREMTYVLTYPDGREQVLLSNLHYNFEWQIFYELKEPLKIPAGSTIKTIGLYDNSPANKSVTEPDKAVKWSEQSWDEMFNGFVEISTDRSSNAQGRAQAPLVGVVGCATRASDGSWHLINATSGTDTQRLFSSAKEVEDATNAPLENNNYRLSGIADFLTREELLKQQRRAEFTRPEVANATGALRDGWKVFVKGPLVAIGNDKALNLVSVQPLTATCK